MLGRDSSEPLVSRPQAGVGGQHGGGKKVRVDIPDAKPEQMLIVDQTQYLHVCRDGCLGEVVEQSENLVAPREVAECKLASHPGVRQHVAILEEPDERWVAGAEMVDPDRRVDKDHAGVLCRRRTDFASGSLPASWASRRALSRSISARRA